jgi:hypothetical protein
VLAFFARRRGTFTVVITDEEPLRSDLIYFQPGTPSGLLDYKTGQPVPFETWVHVMHLVGVNLLRGYDRLGPWGFWWREPDGLEYRFLPTESDADAYRVVVICPEPTEEVPESATSHFGKPGWSKLPDDHFVRS